MTITVGSNTPTGTYPITVTGNGGGIQQNTTVSLTVTAQGQPDFTPYRLARFAKYCARQSREKSTIIDGHQRWVLQLHQLCQPQETPSGTTVSFNPNPIPAPGYGTSTMTIVVGSNTPHRHLSHHGDGQRRGRAAQTITVTLTVITATATEAGFHACSASPNFGHYFCKAIKG